MFRLCMGALKGRPYEGVAKFASGDGCEVMAWGYGVVVGVAGWGQDLKRLVAFTEPKPVAKS